MNLRKFYSTELCVYGVLKFLWYLSYATQFCGMEVKFQPIAPQGYRS